MYHKNITLWEKLIVISMEKKKQAYSGLSSTTRLMGSSAEYIIRSRSSATPCSPTRPEGQTSRN